MYAFLWWVRRVNNAACSGVQVRLTRASRGHRGETPRSRERAGARGSGGSASPVFRRAATACVVWVFFRAPVVTVAVAVAVDVSQVATSYAPRVPRGVTRSFGDRNGNSTFDAVVPSTVDRLTNDGWLLTFLSLSVCLSLSISLTAPIRRTTDSRMIHGWSNMASTDLSFGKWWISPRTP